MSMYVVTRIKQKPNGLEIAILDYMLRQGYFTTA
jgi:hypothetical protein